MATSQVLVLTGAGVSKESGIPTFRDAGGLWEQYRHEEVASPQGFRADPALVWRFYSERRQTMRHCRPNPGHVALAELEAALGERSLLVTQNIDGLHQRAGSQNVVELHGNLFMTRCTVCDRAPFPDEDSYANVPFCGRCAERGDTALLRPHVVWFGEMLDEAALARVERFMVAAGADLVFVAVGTSGGVYPAAGLVGAARRVGGSTWLVNPEPSDNAAAFDHYVQGKSGDVLPELFRAVG